MKKIIIGYISLAVGIIIGRTTGSAFCLIFFGISFLIFGQQTLQQIIICFKWLREKYKNGKIV